jgi:hypothetical protein
MMADKQTLLALFGDPDSAADGIAKLRELGIEQDSMEVISGIPFKEQILGRPTVWTYVPRIALTGAMLGLIFAMFLIFGIPGLFPLHVGGQPLFPVPPFFIIGFEMIMLGTMGFTFIALFIGSRFPSDEPKEYIPEISDGKIAVVFYCQTEMEDRFVSEITAMGAESVKRVEAKKL